MYNNNNKNLVVRDVKTLPRNPIKMGNLNDDKIIINPNACKKNTMEHNNNIDVVNEFCRPTYGAYKIYNSLPRGPYLQYKFNDQQQSLRQLLNENDNKYYHQQEIKQYQNNETASLDFRTISRTELNIQQHHQHKHQQQPQQQQQLLSTYNKQYPNYENINLNNENFDTNSTNLKNQQSCSNCIQSELNAGNGFTTTSTNNNNCPKQTFSNVNNNNKGYQTLPHRLNRIDSTRVGYSYQQCDNERSNHGTKRTYFDPEIKQNHVYAKTTSSQNGNDFLKQIQEKNSNMLARISAAGSIVHNGNNFGKTHSTIIQQHSNDHQKQNQQTNHIFQTQSILMGSGAPSSSVPIAVCSSTASSSSCDSGSGIALQINSQSAKSLSEFVRPMNNLSSNHVNYVTLSDVIRIKSDGLTEYEGWALLCQSVQALQDLFLADTPSTCRILPLVRSSTIQITSRGRVVFSITTIGQLNKFNDAASYFDITSHLSPEYLNNIGKNIAFAESDIEKMWIYSLGITLRNTIKGSARNHNDNNDYGCKSTSVETTFGNPGYDNRRVIKPETLSITSGVTVSHVQYHDHSNGYNHNIINNNNIRNSHRNSPDTMIVLGTTLEKVIGCMCEHNLHHRASLMYLLDVISSFCRSEQQAKPFSHIVMELFKEVTSAPIIENHQLKVRQSRPVMTTLSDGCKSETDSGRSSAYGDKDYPIGNGQIESRSTDNENQNPIKSNERVVEEIGFQKYSTIGYAGIKTLLQKKENKSSQLLVTRRKNNGPILKRRNSFRRNTIDVNLFDLEKARQENFHTQNDGNLNTSKSTNFIDKISGCEPEKNEKKINTIKLTDGISMPDLNSRKTSNIVNLKVRRGIKGFELTKAYSEESFLLKSKGPEFILKSSLPSREIELIETKCQHRRIVSVLLLDGQSVHIGCNSVITTAGQVFEAVIKSENYIENFFIGLCALIGGDFVFLPHDLKIYKVAPQIWVNTSKKSNTVDNVFFTLFLRIKFFLPTLRGISSLESRHMLYLQLRKSILEKHILCTDDDLISLGGLALQSEVGDFKESMKHSEYFTISHYLPEGVYHRNKEMAKYLRNSHFRRRGLHPKEAEQNFIKYIQEMKEYGFHLYSAIWSTDDGNLFDVYVGISLCGIALFQRNRQPLANSATNSKISYQRKLYMSFEWLEIENLCYSKHILCIVVRKTESLKAKDNNRIKYKLRMDGRKSYFAFSLASEHHQFYMKLRNSFISLKSLSNELNIPITLASTQKDKNSEIVETYETISTERKNTNSTELINVIPENIKKIDKQLKTSGLRVRNLKKSMLNDNRLLKLKQKFLRRSKSTVGICSTSSTGKTIANINSENSDVNMKDISGRQRLKLQKNYQADENVDQDTGNDIYYNGIKTTKEENQNKENECPKVYLNDISPKFYSPNRNRVKMGTRVFSSQFLNKSFDNIYDRSLNICRFESSNSIDDNIKDDDYQHNGYKLLDKCNGDMDEIQSLKSTSLSSLYCSEKLSTKESPQPTEAYVIHTSIKSDRDHHYNNFTLPNETISDSLLEKFNNLPGNTTINDRILTKLTVVKERLLHEYHNIGKDKTIQTSNMIRDPIKYATFNQRMVKDIFKGKDKDTNDDGGYCNVNENGISDDIGSTSNRTLNSKGLWLLSKSQESISFENNKFSMRNEESINQPNLPNDLDGFTLGISIVQGSDNNVYVRDLVKNGPGDKCGVQIGDQIVTVNGISLLSLSYAESLKILQNTGLIVELTVSQIYRNAHINYNKNQNNSKSSSLLTLQKDIQFDTKSHENDKMISENLGKSIEKYIPNVESKSINMSLKLGNHDEYLNQMKMIRASAAPATIADRPSSNDVHIKNDNKNKTNLTNVLISSNLIEDDNNNTRPNTRLDGKFKSSTKYVNGNLCGLSPAKSLPDLPKVIAIYPKQNNILNENQGGKTSTHRTVGGGHSRKYLGPLRYPVTPIKTILSPVKHQLSLLADSDDEQVFI